MGFYSDSTTGIEHGYLKNGATLTTIDVPFAGATNTAARGINDAGQVVGSYSDASGGVHGFLKDGATFTPIDIPGASYTAAQGINDAGQIVGFYEVGSSIHSFLATPITAIPEPITAVPEPDTLVMGGTAALLGLGYWWRRRKRAVA